MKREKSKKVNLEKELFLKEKDEQKETRKNKNKSNSNSKRIVRERGITLIALVITIIILLILAGVTLGTALGENGLLQRARQARETYKKAEEEESQGIDKLLEEMEGGSGGGETSPGTSENPETTEPSIEPSQEPSPEPSGGTASEWKEQIESGDTSILEKTVEGLNITGLTEQYNWQIFDVDAEHIYLITTDYIHTDDCPKGKNGGAIQRNGTDYTNSMENLIDDYNGSADVPSNVRNLNSKFFDFLDDKTSTNANAKAMAYMLDTTKWTEKFKDTNDKIEYVIGGPTIEQVFKAYNKKHSTNYNTRVESDTGYQISKGDGSWSTYYANMLDTTDTRFVLTNTSKASTMWVASPSTNGPSLVLYVGCDGSVMNGIYNRGEAGFRPVVSLKSNVTLKESGSGYTIQ